MTLPLSHIVFGTTDMAQAEGFYAPLLTMLGWRRRPSDSTPGKLVWQPATAARPLFVVMPPFDGAAHRVGNGAMVALNAPDRATVDAVHALALKLGGTCEGPPGLRPRYHAHYYGAYFRDRDGNKLCVVCRKVRAGSCAICGCAGPARRPASPTLSAAFRSRGGKPITWGANHSARFLTSTMAKYGSSRVAPDCFTLRAEARL